MIIRNIRSLGFCLSLFCQLSFSSGSTRKHHRRSIENDPRYVGFSFESQPSRNVSVTGPLILDCHYILTNEEHVKDSRLEWRRDGNVITEKSNSRLKQLSNGSLLIDSLTSSDEGTYQCVVHVTMSPRKGGEQADEKPWTFVSKKAVVKVADLPKFDAQPVDRAVGKGQPTAFHCLTTTRPVPRVTWYHNDKPIQSGAEYHILPVSNTLEITSTQARHEGAYKCSVEGADKRRTSQTGRLQFSSRHEPTNELTFISSPRLQIVDIGDEFVLECLVASKIRPEVRWLKDSRQMVVDGTRVRRVGVAARRVSKATAHDSGLYTCRASNTDDSVDKAVAVEVRSPPRITTLPSTKVAIETADVDFECGASGRPETKVSWFKNGEAIIASEYFVIEANRLRILGVVKTDQGVYQCLAENVAGSEQAAAQLLVDAPDSSSVAASYGQPMVASSPLGLRTSSVGSRFIIFEWDPPVQRNGNIMRYHVFYKEVESDRERMINSSATSVTLSSLQPSTLYLLRVAAENEAGMGKSSDPLKVSTSREQAVPGKVTSLIATAIGPETIDIRWSPPAGGQAPLRYKIFYSRDPPEDNEKETLIITSMTQYTLHGMDKYTSYVIRIEAEGENGSGLSSDNARVRTHSDEPSAAPQKVSAEAESSTSIRVTWEEPEEETVNGEITGYRLKYKTKARGSKGNTLVIDATVREYTMRNLDPNTQYLIRMAVVNHNGTGPYSDWLTADTPAQDKEERVLSAPREIRPHAGLDYIVISWLPPADDTNLVRGYQIGWGLGVPDMETERVSASTTQHKIPRLHSGRDYVISLRAFNNQGSGFPIYETIRTLTRGSMPSMFGDDGDHEGSDQEGDGASSPVGVRAESLSATSIRVTWTESDQNAFNTQYTVRYSTSIDDNQQRYVNSTETWATIEGLRPATEYEFAVRAISSSGVFSTWSLATRNRTLPAAPSSAPRDLTVLPAESGDPHSVSLHWQPPKYSNGEIEEYLVYYTDRESLADKDWTINYVAGDKLSHQVSNLLPKANYFFKIQARNEKGYGPFSPVQSYTPSGGVVLSGRERNGRIGYGTASGDGNSFGSKMEEWKKMLLENPLYLGLVVAILLCLVLSIVLLLMCTLKRSASSKNGYTSGKKTSAGTHSGVGGNPTTDLWINGAGSHMRAGASDYMVDGLATAHLTTGVDIESPTMRYQHLQGQGTLTRSYHQSSSSLEGARQRTPQVVYTGTGRHQPIQKIDFCDSPYGSSSALGSAATPPLPMQAPPTGPPTILDGYRTLRGTPPNSANALRSFAQLAGSTPPPTSAVRPTIVTAGSRQLPVGRATAQPRVNVANIYSPYASCSEPDTDKKMLGGVESMEMRETHTPSSSHQQQMIDDTNTTSSTNNNTHDNRPINLVESNSTEELNVQASNLDAMIEDLQAFQRDFVET